VKAVRSSPAFCRTNKYISTSKKTQTNQLTDDSVSSGILIAVRITEECMIPSDDAYRPCCHSDSAAAVPLSVSVSPPVGSSVCLQSAAFFNFAVTSYSTYNMFWVTSSHQCCALIQCPKHSTTQAPLKLD